MFLVDTNIWLELLLDQAEAERVRRFLETTDPSSLYLTDFTLHSIGIVLVRLKKTELFERFVEDLLIEGGVNLIRLSVDEMRAVLEAITRFGLDFDDSYQYVSASNFNLELASFDADFDRTDIKRKKV